MTKAMVHDNALETNIREEYHREFNKYKIIKINEVYYIVNMMEFRSIRHLKIYTSKD